MKVTVFDVPVLTLLLLEYGFGAVQDHLGLEFAKS